MSLKTTTQKIDSTVGILIGNFAELGIIFGSANILTAARHAYPIWMQTLGVLFFIWCLVTGLWFMVTSLKILLRKQSNHASLSIALLQPKIPSVLRLPLSLWWLFHFLMTLIWGIVLTIYDQGISLLLSLMIAGITSGLTYLTFGYLLLTVTVFIKNQEIILRLWKRRSLWALTHGLIIIAVKLLTATHIFDLPIVP